MMKEKTNSALLKIFDLIGIIWWEFFRFTVKIIILTIKAIFNLLKRALDVFCNIKSCHKICCIIKSFFYTIGQICYYLFIIFWLLGLFTRKKCDNSAIARRFFLFSSFIAAILYYYFFTPPFDWGTWYYVEQGVASHYGKGFYFNRTASGNLFLPGPFYTAAHRTLPLGTLVLVVNNNNHRRLVVRINDRGPFISGRDIDLTNAAAARLDIIHNGTAPVTIYSKNKISANAAKITLPEWFSDK